MGETPLVAGAIGGVVRQAPEWLPELVSQSVILRHSSPVQLPSLVRFSRASMRARRQTVELVVKWRGLLATGAVKNRAALARREGVTRAHITQVLGAMAS